MSLKKLIETQDTIFTALFSKSLSKKKLKEAIDYLHDRDTKIISSTAKKLIKSK